MPLFEQQPIHDMTLRTTLSDLEVHMYENAFADIRERNLKGKGRLLGRFSPADVRACGRHSRHL